MMTMMIIIIIIIVIIIIIIINLYFAIINVKIFNYRVAIIKSKIHLNIKPRFKKLLEIKRSLQLS